MSPHPFYTIRQHSSPTSAIAFSKDNSLLYTGDQDGYVGVTDTNTKRVIAYWKAHQEGVLGLDEWDGRLISHGRDNVIHIHHRIPLHRRLPTNEGPPIWKSLPVNALNFCRFSLLPLLPSDGLLPVRSSNAADGSSTTTVAICSSNTENDSGQVSQAQALLAVPGLLDSELCDIYHLPSMKRLHVAVNAPDRALKPTGNLGQEDKTGIIMSIQLRYLSEGIQSLSVGWEKVGLVLGYEDGRVEVWGVAAGQEGNTKIGWLTFSDGSGQVGKRIWSRIWKAKVHKEAVMGMAVNQDASAVYTVSADHQLVKYDCRPPIDQSSASSFLPQTYITTLRSIGHACLTISRAADNQVLAVGGWDGHVRLLSARSLKSLGTLRYHRDGVQAVAFANPPIDKDGVSRVSDRASTVDLDLLSATASSVDSASQDQDSNSGSDTETEQVRLPLRKRVAEKDQSGKNVPIHRWMASGAKDRRIALWGLMDFAT